MCLELGLSEFWRARMDKYELVKDIGAGNFGVARLMKVKNSKELVAMKYIERGPKVLLIFLICNYLLLICLCVIALYELNDPIPR